MTPEELERVAGLERRLADLEARLAHMESTGTAKPEPPPIAYAAPQRSRPPLPPPVPPRSWRPSVTAPPAVPRERPRLEVRVGLNWLSRIAVVTVVLALAFFFQYAFENHWITESGRVLLGVACGAAALAFGEWAWRKQQHTYGQSLTAAGIAFLYLSVWAAFGLYLLLSQAAAFGLMIAITVSSGALALRYEAPVVAILGLGGGFATPLLLGSAGAPWFVLGYGTLLDVCALLASRARRWRWLEVMALAGTVLLFGREWPGKPEFAVFVLVWFALFAMAGWRPVSAAAQVLAGMALSGAMPAGAPRLALTWLLAAAGMALADRRNWTGGVSAAFTGFWLAYWLWFGQASHPGLAIPLAVLAGAYFAFLGGLLRRGLLTDARMGWREMVVLALNATFTFGACYGLRPYALFAVAIAVVQMAAARIFWTRRNRAALLSAGTAWVLLVLAVPIQFAGYRVTMAWAAEAAALLWIGVRLRESWPQRGALAVFALVLIRLALFDSRMFPNEGAYPLLFNARMLTFLISAAAFWAAAWWVRSGGIAAFAYSAGHVILLGGLCQEAVGWAARNSMPDNFSSSARTAISAVAAAYAVAMVAGGSLRLHSMTRLMGIGLIGLVVVKLYFYDVWMLAAFYRMAAFAILGVLLLAVSFFYRTRTAR